MKLYHCLMLDESLDDWTHCTVAVMEDRKEQDEYYSKNTSRQTFLKESGYSDYDEDEIEFWFPYELDGYPYAEKIANNVSQYAWDTYYGNFEYIEKYEEWVNEMDYLESLGD